MATVLGIDFGSSLCRTAVFRNGQVESFPNRFSERKLPVMIGETDGIVSFTSIKQNLGFSETEPPASELFHAIRQDATEATGEHIDAAVVTGRALHRSERRFLLEYRQGKIRHGRNLEDDSR